MTRICLATGLLLLVGCGRDEPRVDQPVLSPEGVARKALEEYDTNKDGVLSADELERCPALKNSMGWLNTNKDGKLTAAEIAGRIRSYQESKIALLSVTCQVTLDGKPVPDATVTFVPEKFMGTTLKPAAGVTDANGKVRLSSALGFFKVEVSLKDAVGKETLPARYNSQTLLGQEAGPGVPNLKGVVKLALTSD